MDKKIIQKLTIPRPDDWHLHLRDGDIMKAVLPSTARQFARALVMPNLAPPVITAADAKAYRRRIQNALPEGLSFTPYMAAYLTESTDPDDLTRGFEENTFLAAKLYPAGATTNSDSGVRNLRTIHPILEKMQRIGMPLSIHGEVTDPDVDFFDREAVFIDRVLAPLRKDFPELRIVMEHLTTRQAVQYVQENASTGALAGTITPHHLWLNRTAIFEKGVDPHLFCLPILKREEDRQALVKAATSGNKCFFAGTDSAPHAIKNKETHHGKGGIFTAPLAMSLYAQIFDDAAALDLLADFTSINGCAFYNLPMNAETLNLEKTEESLPPPAPLHPESGETIVAFSPETPLFWRISLS